MLVIHFIIAFIISLVLFLGGMYFYAKRAVNTSQCPNLLIQFDAKYYLFNTNQPRSLGINPIMFNTMEDYTNFLTWQNKVGIKCPVLYVQKTYDAQGKRVYKMRPSVEDVKGGLPPSTPKYIWSKLTNTSVINESTCDNQTEEIPGPVMDILLQHGSNVEDPTMFSQFVDDVVFEKNTKEHNNYPGNLTPCPVPTFKSLSDNPMDVNWGGEDHTEKSVKEGKYIGSEVSKSHFMIPNS